MDFVYDFQSTAEYVSEDEKLIPVIRLMRKLLSCNSDQKVLVLQRLVKIFESHEVSAILMDIIVAGLCHDNIYQKIPTAVYDEIQLILPSDKQLDLKDSVHTSQLVEEEDHQKQTVPSIKKEKTLPWTLLRVPTDVQCKLFQYLHFKDLINVQKVCRALCIETRNPLAIYRLDISPLFSRSASFAKKEWLSQPKVLSIDEFLPPHHHDIKKLKSPQPITGNDVWGKHVVELYVRSYNEGPCSHYPRNNPRYPTLVHDLGQFYKLQKCTIRSSLLPHGLTASYDTLKELTLERFLLTEDAIVQIQKFQNLETLSLLELKPTLDDRLHHSEPISLRNLKMCQIEICAFRDFQRLLIGSNPATEFRISTWSSYWGIDREFVDREFAPELPIPQMPAINQVVIWDADPDFIVDMGTWMKAQSSNFKVFDQITLSNTMHYTHMGDRVDFTISPIINIFERSNRSKLKLKCYPVDVTDSDMESVVNAILNAPFGTFTEIELYIAFGLDHLAVPPRERTRNEETMRNVIKERVDDAGRWLEPWLLFDERRMKHMGLQTLDIELYLDVDPDYDDMNDWDDCRSTMKIEWYEKKYSKADKSAHIFDKVIEMYLKEQIRHWNSIGRKCISTKSNEDERVYTMTLSLRI